MTPSSLEEAAYCHSTPAFEPPHPMAPSHAQPPTGVTLAASRSAGSLTQVKSSSSGSKERVTKVQMPKSPASAFAPTATSAATTAAALPPTIVAPPPAAPAPAVPPGVPPPLPSLQPEVRLHFEGDRYMPPQEVHTQLLGPAGVSGVLAVVAVSPRESRVPCRTWAEAYSLLSYCTADVQRKLGLKCRPACVEGVQLTRTQMARLAQSEGPPHPHILRAGSPRASSKVRISRKRCEPVKDGTIHRAVAQPKAAAVCAGYGSGVRDVDTLAATGGCPGGAAGRRELRERERDGISERQNQKSFRACV